MQCNFCMAPHLWCLLAKSTQGRMGGEPPKLIAFDVPSTSVVSTFHCALDQSPITRSRSWSDFVKRGANHVRGLSIMSRNTATLLSLLMLTATSVAAAESEERSIRAGFTLAAHRCAACHIASPRQTLKPLFPGVPKFEDIANRPSTSRQSLIDFLASEHGYKYSSDRPPTLRAQRPLTDRERSDVAFYILSFRNKQTVKR